MARGPFSEILAEGFPFGFGIDRVPGWFVEPVLFVGGGQIGDVDFACVEKLPGDGGGNKAVVGGE
ncbi:MAG: hypothetical protein VX293_02380 [Candidatus Latescibacterota bacterium]|nr:hypothetical protein [Candidatus Latescibacterota bacterium]